MAKQLNSASAQVNMVFTADASQAKAEIAGLQKDLTSLTTNSFKNMGINSQVSKAVSEVTRLKAILTDATGETGKLDLSKFTKSLSQSGMSIGSIANSLNSLGGSGQAAFAKLASSILKAEVPLKQTSNLITEMKNTLVNSARWTIASSAIKGISSGISDAYQYAQDLNKSLTDIRIVSGKSADDMARFAIEANKAAKALNTTTGRYANASLIYYQQGLGEAAVKERTDITTKMANVTGQSAETVSSQLTAVWNNFDNGSKSLEYFADVMVKLGAYTASSSDEISTGLQKFAPIAKTVGLSYEYAASALATLTATTRESADTVGTALKGIFSRLQGLKLGETLEDGTDLNKYTKALATVGVDVKNANGELKDMDTILDEIAAKWDTLGRAQQVALANTVGGTQRYTQFMSLMNNWDYMQELVGVSKSSEGTLDAQAQIYAESWDAATAKVRASLEGLWKNLINEDFFIGATNALGDLIDKITALSTGLGGLPGILSLVANSLMKTFGPEIATSINNMADNFMATSKFGKGKMAGDKMSAVDKLVDMTQNSASIGEAERRSSLAGYTAQQRMTAQMLSHRDDWGESQFNQAGALLDSVGESTQKAKTAAEQKDNIDFKTDRAQSARERDLAKKTEVVNADFNKRQMDLGSIMATATEPDEWSAAEAEVRALADITSGKAQQRLKEHMRGALANNDLNGRLDSLSKQAQGFASGRGSDKDFENFKKDLLEQLGDETKDKDYKGGIEGVVKQLREAIENDDKDAINKAFQDISTKNDSYSEGAAEEYADYLSKLGVYSSEEIANKKQAYMADLDKRGEGAADWSKAHIENNANVRGAEEGMGQIKGPTSSWGDVFSDVAQTATGAMQAVYGFKGAIDALNNEDMSFGDKFIAAAGGVVEGTQGLINFGSGVKDIVSDFKGLNLGKGIAGKGILDQLSGGDQELAGTLLSTIANHTGDTAELYTSLNAVLGPTTASTISMTQAETLLGNSAGIANAEFAAQILKFGLIAAAVAAVIAVIYLLAKAYDDQRNSAEKNFEVQSQKLQQLQSDYSSLTEAVNTFKSTASNYSDCVAALEELEQGTLAYREAVLSANEAAQELLNQYPGLDYSVGSNGLIQIDKEAIEDAQNNLISQQEVAASAVHLQQAKVRDAQTAVDIEDFYNEKHEPVIVEEPTKGSDNVLDAFDTTQGAANKPNAADTSDNPLDWAQALDKQLEETKTDGDWTDQNYKDLLTDIFTSGEFVLDDLLKGTAGLNNKYAAQYNDAMIEDAQNFLSDDTNEDQVTDLWNKADQASLQKQNDYQLAATGRFTQEELYGDEKDAALIPEEIKASYAAAVGEAYANEADKIPDLTAKALKDYAQNEYAEKMGYDTSQIKTIKDDDGNISYQFSDKNGQLIAGSEVSAAYLQNLYKNGKIDASPEELVDGQSAQKYWREQIQDQVDKIDKKDVFEAGVKEATGATVEETTDNAQLQLYADLLTQFDKSKSEEDFGKFLEKINGLKLTEPEEAITQLQQIAQDFNLTPVYDEILRLLGLNDEASNMEETPESIYNTYKDMQNSVSGLGDTITQEQYDKMEEDGLDPDQWFTKSLTGDGYEFSSLDVDGFQDTMREKAVSGYEEAITGYEQTANDFSAMNGKGVTLEGLRGENGESASLDDKITALGDLNDGTYDELLNRLETDDALERGHSQEDMKAVTEAIQELTEGYENLDDIIDETTTKSEALQDALDFEKLKDSCEKYGTSLEDVQELAEALLETGKFKGDDAARRAEEAAEMYLRQKDAMAELTEACDEYSDACETYGDKSSEATVAQEKMAKALEKIFKTDFNKMPKTFQKMSQEGKLNGKTIKELGNIYLDCIGKDINPSVESLSTLFEDTFVSKMNECLASSDQTQQEMGRQMQQFLIEREADVGEFSQDAQAGLDAYMGVVRGVLIDLGATETQAEQVMAGLSAAMQIEMPDYEVVSLPVDETVQQGYEYTATHGYDAGSYDVGPKSVNYEEVPRTVEPTIKPAYNFTFVRQKDDKGGKPGESQAPKKGGGGGGNKGSKPKTPTAHKKSDTSKRYHAVKQNIEKAEGDKDRIAKNKERAFGKEKIKQAEEEIVLQQKKLKYQTIYAKEVQEFLKEDSEALDKYAKEFNSKWAKSFANTPLAEGIHLEINKDGIIENFQEIEDALLAGENKIIDMENAMGGESTVEMDLMQRAIDDMREYIDRYETTLQLYEEVMNQMWEDADELDKLFLELTNIKVELKVDVTEDKLSFLEYLLGKIEEDTYKVADAMSYLGQSANASMDKIVAYREGIDEIFRRRFQGVGKEDLLSKFYDGSITLSDMINPDTGALDLGFTQDDIEQIRDYRDGLIEAMEALNELRTTELDKLTESLETFNEQLEGQTSVLESHVSILEAYRDIVDLIGTHNISQGKVLLSQINQGRMGALRVQLSESKNVYEALLTQRDEYQKALNDVMDTGNEDAIHEWQKRLADIEEIVNDAKDNFLSNFQDALDAAVDILESSVELAADDFDKMLSPLYSTIDALQDAYDRQETVDNDYVQDYEKYYALAKDIRTLDEMLDDTDSIAAKNRLLKLQQEIVAQKAEDVKLSQYDLDVLEKRIELEKARIALEDAENDKTTVTLNRDSEGNWGYVYSTDEENVREKEQEYEDKLKEYQDLNKDYIDDLQSQIVDFEADTRDALSEIWEDTTLSEIEKLAQTEQIQQTALAHIRALTEQMSKATENQASTYELAVDRYQQSNMDLIDSFKETRLSELTGFKDTNEVLNTFTTSLDAYITQLTALQKTYDASVDAITKDAATEDWLREIITDIAGINAGSVDISENIRTLSKDMSDTFSAGAQAAATFEETYANVISNMVDENEKFIASLTNMIALLAKLNEANPEWQNLWDEFNSHKELVNAGEVSEKEWDAWYEDWADRVDDWIDSLKATGSYNEATDVALEDMAGSITLAASNMIKANADAASGNTNLQAPTMTDNSTTNNTTTNNNYYINGTVVDPTAIVADFIEETFDESSIDA